jgi:YVTN family beta-propeller protein
MISKGERRSMSGAGRPHFLGGLVEWDLPGRHLTHPLLSARKKETMSRYRSGRLPANRWPLWGLVALAALAACGDESPAGPTRDITPGSLLLSTAPGDGAFAYVTNFDSDNVSVIRSSDNTVVASVAVGNGPTGVAVTPDGTVAYVANNSSNNVSVIRTSDNTVVATVAVGRGPFGVAVTPTTEACTIEALRDHVEALVAAGKLSQAEGHALSVKLEAVLRLLERGKTKAAGNVIGAFLNQVEALVRSRRLSDADAGPLRDQAACVRTQLHG